MKAKASVSHFTNCIFFGDILEYNTVKSTHGSCAVRAMMTMNDNGRFTILYDAQCSYQLFLIYRVRFHLYSMKFHSRSCRLIIVTMSITKIKRLPNTIFSRALKSECEGCSERYTPESILYKLFSLLSGRVIFSAFRF